MTRQEKEDENKLIVKLKAGCSEYKELPAANTVIRVSSHLPSTDRLMWESPTKDYDNIFLILVKDFINPEYSAYDRDLFDAVKLIDSGDLESGKAILKRLIGYIEEESGKNIYCSIIGSEDGEITAEKRAVRRTILTRGFPDGF